MWDKQQKDDLEEAGGQSAMARFRDFKIFMETNHVDKYLASGSDLNLTNLLPFLPVALATTSRLSFPTSNICLIQFKSLDKAGLTGSGDCGNERDCA